MLRQHESIAHKFCGISVFAFRIVKQVRFRSNDFSLAEHPSPPKKTGKHRNASLKQTESAYNTLTLGSNSLHFFVNIVVFSDAEDFVDGCFSGQNFIPSVFAQCFHAVLKGKGFDLVCRSMGND